MTAHAGLTIIPQRWRLLILLQCMAAWADIVNMARHHLNPGPLAILPGPQSINPSNAIAQYEAYIGPESNPTELYNKANYITSSTAVVGINQMWSVDLQDCNALQWAWCEIPGALYSCPPPPTPPPVPPSPPAPATCAPPRRMLLQPVFASLYLLQCCQSSTHTLGSMHSPCSQNQWRPSQVHWRLNVLGATSLFLLCQ